MLSQPIHLPSGVARFLSAYRARLEREARAQGREAKPWYRIEARDLAAGEAEIFIYAEISPWGVTANDFVAELRALNVERLVVHINSPGGLVDDGIAIFNALREHPATVEVRIDALAASIASVIAMAGDRVVMNAHSSMMIHDASVGLDFYGYYNADEIAALQQDLQRALTYIDHLSETIAGVYAGRAGGTASEWRAAMRAETWYTPESAVAAGLADEAVAYDTANNARFDLSIFKHPPRDHAPAPAAAQEPRDHVDDQPEATPAWKAAALIALAEMQLEVA